MAFDFSLIGVKKNIPKVNFTDYSGIFVAPPKFGKTTTAAKFPNSVIVPFEDGAKGQVANVVEDFDDWSSLIDFIDKLEDNREIIGSNVQTIVFDTANKAYDMCETYTLMKMSAADGKRYKKPKDVPHGGFYPERDKNFALQIDRIIKLGFTILFLSHSKVKTIRPKDGEAYDVYSSTMPDRLEAIVNPLVDFIIYGERRVVDDKPTRALITKGNEMASDTGNRVYMNEDILFETEDEAMSKYQELFRKQIETRLTEEGITEKIEEIAKRQHEEKMDKVKDYLEQEKETKAEQYKEDITAIIDSLDKDNKLKLAKEFMSKFNNNKYLDVTDSGELKKYLEVAKSYPTVFSKVDADAYADSELTFLEVISVFLNFNF